MSEDSSKNGRKEQRRYPRVSVDLPIEYRPEPAAQGVKMRTEKITVIGEGGCFIQTRLTYPKETRLVVKYSVGGADIETVALVRYSVAFATNAPGAQFPGMGVQFEGISEEHQKVIRKFVTQEQLKQGLGVTTPSS